MSKNSYTRVLSLEQAAALRRLLAEGGFQFSEKQYAMFSAAKGKLNITVYEKGPKILVQGKETEDFVQFRLEPEILGVAELGYEEVNQSEMFEPHFGIDESGKGDFFGPLVIAGVYVDPAIARHLLDHGVMDSKRITSDARIRTLANLIRETPGIVCEVLSLGPEKYNALYGRFHNLNRLLAWGHAKVIENLLHLRPGCPRALSDQFANPQQLERALMKMGRTIELQQRTKAESDIAVAAASIIARERFIDWLDECSRKLGYELAKGVSDAVVTAGRKFVSDKGAKSLPLIAKMHFKTAAQFDM
ncbi:MAG: ribonuclease HIII [Verrucomicrobia bacterium]|nr:ribonuclease HIII [Verrucomicrobiota bacterium]